MTKYLVEYRQTDPDLDDIEGGLSFDADDIDHAIEQAHDHLSHDSWDYDILSVVNANTDNICWKKY